MFSDLLFLFRSCFFSLPSNGVHAWDVCTGCSDPETTAFAADGTSLSLSPSFSVMRKCTSVLSTEIETGP